MECIMFVQVSVPGVSHEECSSGGQEERRRLHTHSSAHRWRGISTVVGWTELSCRPSEHLPAYIHVCVEII